MDARIIRHSAALAGAGLLFAACPGLTPPAHAEVIHLKNGTQVKGKITKQDEENFEVLTAQGPVKISKLKVQLVDLANPAIAAGLGVGFPGAGQAYVGRWDKAVFYFSITAVTLGAAFVVGMVGVNGGLTVSDPNKLTLPVSIGVSTAGIPLLLGAYDAYLEAVRQNEAPKFKIDYGESL
ncbi:MAG: hypothetical protein FJZ01_03200 [Candidatus Sericytochromatia bacterium]|nr:hypothetical protein [Candidatus Tanganyikabacteria bacterium]